MCLIAENDVARIEKNEGAEKPFVVFESYGSKDFVSLDEATLWFDLISK